MRNVLKSVAEVVHYWANKVQPSGNSGSVSFRDGKLYSYSACVGCFLPDGSVAISNKAYSMTTSRHQAAARSGSKHLQQVLVPYPDSLVLSLESGKAQTAALIEKASVARYRRDYYVGEATTVADNFNLFAAACGSDLRIDMPGELDLDTVRVRVMEKQAVSRAEAAKREELRTLELGQLIDRWRARVWLGSAGYRLHEAGVALRVYGDTVQSSHGAEIPVEHAKKLWPLVQRVVAARKDYTPAEVKLGVYRLDAIRRDGSIVVGCHDIPYSELLGVAKTLGLVSEEVAI